MQFGKALGIVLVVATGVVVKSDEPCGPNGITIR